jgi:hypothetical protein
MNLVNIVINRQVRNRLAEQNILLILCINVESRSDKALDRAAYPIRTKSTSDMTIMNNPTQITPMTPANVHVGRSSLNRNANISTNANDDDLHMAIKRRGRFEQY